MHIACGFGRLKSVQALVKMCPSLIEQVDDKGHNPIDVSIKVLLIMLKLIISSYCNGVFI